MKDDEVKESLFSLIIEELKFRLGEGYSFERDGDNIIVVDNNKVVKKKYNNILKSLAGRDIVDDVELVL